MVRSRQSRRVAQAGDARTARAGRKALALSALCVSTPLTDAVRDEFDAPLTALLRAAEARIRAQVAARLAACSWAPRAAVRMLAFDAIEIARPVLEASLVLSESDLLALADIDREHRIALARRPRLSADLVAVLTAPRERACLLQIARNPGAVIGPASTADYGVAARSDEVLQRALADRGDLSAGLARALYAVAADSVRATLTAAFPDLGRSQLDQAADVFEPDQRPLAAVNEDLAGQLDISGGLTIADVMRAAENGRADIADHAIARLTGMEPADWRVGFRRSPLRVCLLAARAMAMSEAEAAAFYDAMAEAGRTHAMDAALLRKAVDEHYGAFSRDSARRALHRMTVSGSIR